MFKAGDRLADIMRAQGWERKDLVPILDKSLGMIGIYLKKQRFSSTVLLELRPLRDYGFNVPDYFEIEDAPMRLENKDDEKAVQTEIWNQIIQAVQELTQEVKRNSENNERLYQLLKNRK